MVADHVPFEENSEAGITNLVQLVVVASAFALADFVTVRLPIFRVAVQVPPFSKMPGTKDLISTCPSYSLASTIMGVTVFVEVDAGGLLIVSLCSSTACLSSAVGGLRLVVLVGVVEVDVD